MRIETIPCLRDNYAYLVIDEDRREASVVDPSEALPVQAALDEHGVTLVSIWLTHHHWDHVGGVVDLKKDRPDMEVLGSAYDLREGRIAGQTRGFSEGDSFEHAGHTVRILEIPGHTLGAIAFVLDGNVFSGDTLFLGGCGRVFEGTMEMMTASLDKLRRLPRESKIYCGHEYTVKNLDFARTVEPDNTAIALRLNAAMQARSDNRPTVPGVLEDELRTNPFLRFDEPSVAQGRTPEESFTALRQAKDHF